MTSVWHSRSGHEPASGLYHEHSDRRVRTYHHSCSFTAEEATGAAFRRTPDDRPGWADELAERGVECWVTDWPGVGRSGGRNPLEVVYADVVDGYVNLLTDIIRRPCIILCH